MRKRRRTDAEIMGAAEAREECKRREVGGTEKKRWQGRCLKTQRNSEKEKKVKRKKHKRERRTEGWTGGSEVETRRGRGEKREREEEAPSVSLRAPAGGSSSCLPSQRRFLLHFK